MHPLRNGSQAEQRPASKPLTGLAGWFTESGDNNVPSYPGADWFNHVIAEFQNALAEMGVTFDPDSDAHLAQAFGFVESKLLEKISVENNLNKLHSLANNKIRKTKALTICCLGDSLTYGYDIYSSDRLDGNVHGINGSTVDRASKQYPEEMQKFLRSSYGSDNITVINRGYSGDTAATAYDRWTVSSGADVTLIMLGTNDANSTWGTKVEVDVFIENYKKLVERELEWGSAVIVCLPPATADGNNTATDIYGKALISLANQYSLPVVDVRTFSDGYEKSTVDYGIYSDGTHFNGLGYEIIAARMSAIFLGTLFNNPFVDDDHVLLSRPVFDGITLSGAYQSQIPGAYTPDNLVIVVQPGGTVTYSFYLANDSFAYPVFYAPAGSNVTLKIDFGVIRKKRSLNYQEDFGAGQQVYTYDFINSGIIRDIYGTNGNNDPVVLGAGWHSISVTNDENSAGNLTFNALSLKTHILSAAEAEIIPIKGYHILLSHPVWSGTPSPVSELRVSASALGASLGINNIVDGVFYRNPLVKLVIEDDGKCFTYGYFYHLPNQGADGGLSTTEVVTVQTSGTPEADPVLISDVAYDNVNEEFVITLTKAFSRIFNIVITVA